jgi:hypothetical protein
MSNDYHRISGLDTAGVTEVHYLLIPTYNAIVQHGMRKDVFESIVNNYVSMLDEGATIGQVLTRLNESYSSITNRIEDTVSYSLTIINGDDTVNELDTRAYTLGLDLGPNLAAAAYYNEGGYVCVDVFNVDLELITTYVSNEKDLVTVRIIDNRLYIITSYNDENYHEVIAIMKDDGFIKTDYIPDNPDDNRRSSNDYPNWAD